MSIFRTALSPKASSQYLGIDLMRFLAAFLVMLFHLVYLTSARQGSAYWMSSGQIQLQEAWRYTNWGWVGVQIFFVISGFVIALSAQHATPRSFVASRVARLAPGVWICAPLTFLLAAVLMHDIRLSELLHSLFFIPFGPWMEVVYWTLGIELCFYALVWSLIVARRVEALPILGIVIGAVSTLFWVLHFDLGERFTLLETIANSRWSELMLIQHGCEFAIGILLWHNLTDIPREVRHRNYAMMIVFGLGAGLQIYEHHLREIALVEMVFSAHWPIALWVSAVLFLAWSTSMAKQPPAQAWYRGVFRQMGLVTYPLYLLHLSLGAYTMGFLAHRGLSSAQSALVTISLVVGLSWVIAIFLEPPLQKLTRSALQNSRTPSVSSPPPAATPHHH